MDPDKPTVLTFYVGLYTPGKSAAEQGTLNRAKLLATPYAEYERTLIAPAARASSRRAASTRRRDVAGIILNRWGHARLVQPPGWYYGTDGKPAPREIVAKGFGRIAHRPLGAQRPPERDRRDVPGQAFGRVGRDSLRSTRFAPARSGHSYSIAHAAIGRCPYSEANMFLIRDIMYCKPAKARPMVEKFPRSSKLSEKIGMGKMRVMTDVSAERYWTVVSEMEVDSLEKFTEMSRKSGEMQGISGSDERLPRSRRVRPPRDLHDRVLMRSRQRRRARHATWF